MKHLHRTLPSLALSAACLFAAPSALAGASPVQGGSSLSEFIEAPEVYFELYDIGAFERDVRATGLGRLTTQMLPFLEQTIDEASLPEDVTAILEGTLLPVLGGDLSYEDGLAATVADALEFKLGMTSGDAVTVAAAIGTRFSFALDVDFARTRDNEHWAMGLGLRPGGDLAIVDLFLPRIAQVSGEDIAQRNVSLERDATGVYGAWNLDDDDGYLVVRPGLLAIVSDQGMVDRVLHGSVASSAGGGRRAVVTQFQMKRNDSMHRSERAWLYVSGDLSAVKMDEGSDEERRVSEALGFDKLGDFELSLAAQNGQLVSRVRVEKRGAGGILGLARGRDAKWTTMRLLTADTLLVAGVPQSPSVVTGDLLSLVESAEASAGGSEVAEAAAIIAGNSILSALSDRGAFGDETLLFVRPGAAGIPMVYLAAEATPGLEQSLASLEQYEVGSGLITVRTKQIDGQTAWLISTEDIGKQWGLAIMRREGGVVASYSLLGLQAYARERSRESEEDRLALIAGVRSSLAVGPPSGGASRIAGFAHVRVEPLAEWVWPMALMGLSMSGVAGLEDLPDAVELAEQVGDTTLILYDYDDRLELWGRGLLGGLGILF